MGFKDDFYKKLYDEYNSCRDESSIFDYFQKELEQSVNYDDLVPVEEEKNYYIRLCRMQKKLGVEITIDDYVIFLVSQLWNNPKHYMYCYYDEKSNLPIYLLNAGFGIDQKMVKDFFKNGLGKKNLEKKHAKKTKEEKRQIEAELRAFILCNRKGEGCGLSLDDLEEITATLLKYYVYEKIDNYFCEVRKDATAKIRRKDKTFDLIECFYDKHQTEYSPLERSDASIENGKEYNVKCKKLYNYVKKNGNKRISIPVHVDPSGIGLYILGKDWFPEDESENRRIASKHGYSSTFAIMELMNLNDFEEEKDFHFGTTNDFGEFCNYEEAKQAYENALGDEFWASFAEYNGVLKVSREDEKTLGVFTHAFSSSTIYEDKEDAIVDCFIEEEETKESFLNRIHMEEKKRKMAYH